jgi:putative tricarboxylic transport membrane protein
MLGPLTERSFIQSMAISDGSFSIFVHSPIALTILIFAAGLFVFSIAFMRRAHTRRRALQLATTE